MKRRERQAVVIALMEALSEKGSWCGETHIQKACYFLQELTNVPLKFTFVLYKYGPYSFDLRNEMTAMRADGFITLNVQPPPYGPSLVPSQHSKLIISRWHNTVFEYKRQINFVANVVSNRQAHELEGLSTALYLSKKYRDRDPEECAKLFSGLKPHISEEKALHFLQQVEEIQRKWKRTSSR